MARVTIQDLADRLGLSKFSVSRALSGKPGVSEGTRKRVRRAAHAMGYRLNQDTSPATGLILFVRQEIDPVGSERWLNVMHGAEREGDRLGFSIQPRQARHLLEAPHLDPAVVGIVLAAARPAEIADQALATGLPVVSVNYIRPFDAIDQVVGADRESGLAVARLLVGLGHRRLVFAHGRSGPVGRAERLRGFRESAAAAGCRVDDLVFDESAGFRPAFLSYLRDGGEATAVFCAHDGIAVTVVSELLRLGIRVPDDISVVGFNDLAVASQVSPKLTTLRSPMAEMGAMAVRCIADRIARADDGAMPPLRIGLVAELVLRESTGIAAEPIWLPRVLQLAGERA